MTKDASLIFKALADSSRLRILRLLSERELCVCDLVETLAMGQSKVSRHLAYLKRSGLITGRENGKWSYYSLAKPQSELHRRLVDCVGRCLEGVNPFDQDIKRVQRKNRTCN